MATANELRQVLVQNKNKRGTPEYAELYSVYRRKREEEYKALKLVPDEEPGFLDQLEELAKGVPAGIIGLGELGAIGAAALLDEEEELKVRSGIQSVAKSLKSPFTADVGSEELVGRKFGEALGSFVGLGLTSLIPGAGMPAAAGLAMGAGAGEASERARAAGATERERATAALKGTVVGATELIPLGKLRSLRSSLGDSAFLNGIERIKRAAVAGGFEGAQEAAAGVLQNAIQRGYDPTQELLNIEVAEEGGYGAAVGATVQALLDVAVPGRPRGGRSSISEEESEAVLAEYEEGDKDATRTKLEEKEGEEGEGTEVSDADIEKVTGVKTDEEVVDKDRSGLNKKAVNEAKAAFATQTKDEAGKKSKFKPAEEKFIEKLIGLHQERAKGASVEETFSSQLTKNELAKANTPRIRDEVKRRLGEIQAGRRVFSLEELVVIKQAKYGVPTAASEVANRQHVKDEIERQRKDEKQVVADTEVGTGEGTEGQVVTGTTATIDPTLEDSFTAYSDALQNDPGGGEVFLKNLIDTGEISSEDADVIRNTYRAQQGEETEVTEGTGTGEGVDTDARSIYKLSAEEREEQIINDLVASYQKNLKEGNKLDPSEFSSQIEGGAFSDLISADRIPAVKKELLRRIVELDASTDTDATRTKLDELSSITDQFKDVTKIEYTDTVEQTEEGIPEPQGYKGTAKAKTAKDTSLVGNIIEAWNEIKPLREHLTKKGRSVGTLKAADQETIKDFNEYFGEGWEEAAVYFSTYSAPEDALRVIAFERKNTEQGPKDARVTKYVLENSPKEIQEFFKGTSGAKAKEAYKWIETKLEEKELSEDFGKRLSTEYGLSGDWISAIKEAQDARSDSAQQRTTRLKRQKERYVSGEITFADLMAPPSGLTPEQIEKWQENIKEAKKKLKDKKAQRVDQDKKQAKAREEREKKEARESEVRIYSEEEIATENEARVLKAQGASDTTSVIEQGRREQELFLSQLDVTDRGKYKIASEKKLKLQGKEWSEETQKNIDLQSAILQRLLIKGRLKAEKAGLYLQPRLMPIDVISEFTQPLHRGTTSLLANNDLEGALNSVSASSANIRLKNISKKFAALAGDTKVEIVKDLKDPRDQRPLAGLFDPKTNTIKLDSVVGLNEHTLVHEMAHALGSANIQAFLDGKLKLKTNAAASRLVEIYNNTKDLLGSAYGAENVHEFFAEAAGNEEFRMELARIHPKGSPKSALEQVVEWFRNIVKRLLGWDSVTLKEVDTLIDALISPAPMRRDAEILAMDGTVRGAEKKLKGLGKAWKWLSTRATERRTREWVNGVEQAGEDLGSKVIRTVFGAIDLPGIAELSKKIFGAIGKNLQVTAEKQRGAMELSDRHTDIVVNHTVKFKDNEPKEYDRLNEIIYSREYGATINQVDPLIEKESKAKKEYGGDPKKLAAWKKLNKEWRVLSPEGKRTYKILRNFYKREFKSLKDTLYNRLKNITDEDQADAANAAGVNIKVLDALFSDKVLDVYFPLARQGRFKIEYTLKDVPDGYAMEMVDTKAEARAIKQQLQENEDLIGKPEIVDTREPFSGAYRAPPIRFIEEILRKVDQKLGYAAIELSAEQLAVREGVRSKIVEVFIASLPETSFAKSLAKRKNTPGYEADVLFALQTKGYDLGRQVARIEYTRQVSALESELIEKYKTLRGDDNSEYNSALYAELMERAEFIRNPPVDQYAQLANQGAFIYTIGFNVSSAVVNLSQLPLFAFPYLAGEYQNTTSAFNEIMKASSFVSSSFKNYDVGIDNYYTVDVDGNYRLNKTKLKELTDGMSKAEATKKEKELTRLMPLVQMAAARGQLTKSFLIDELSLQREAGKGGRARSGGVFRKTLDAITSVSAMGFNVAERFNRQSTMIAAYNLELNRISKGKDGYTFTEEQLAEAADKALYMTQETNGGAFRETGPRLSQQGWKRVALMYKTYGFRMYQTMIKSGIRAIKGTKFSDNPKENERLRNVAIRQLIGFHATSVLFAGVYGIPMYGAISVLYDLIWADDEEDDFDNMIRKQITEIPYKGVVNEILGVDVASRIRLSGLLLQSNKYSANASAEETIGFYIGGPAISTAKRFGRGVKYLSEGEVERGIENMLPAGIANFIKASPMGRVYREGFTTQRGDPIYDDVTTGDLAGQLFGFAPLEYIRRIEENQNAKGIDDTIKRRRSKLLKKLYVSIRIRNASEQVDARKEIAKFNRRHPRYAINYTSIKRSIKAHQRTSATMHNGVVLSPQMRTILRQMREGEG